MMHSRASVCAERAFGRSGSRGILLEVFHGQSDRPRSWALAVVVVLIGGVATIIGIVILDALLVLAVCDLIQRKHSILRNYPVAGHMRHLLESIRPEIQQYFIERNFESRPR